ncbi:type II toxin-antitoxin system Phd/YefM family antitoxin (plasmid) [Methylomarinum sp. Ch1-1]|uniref:Antitoxin n=1 Tax=Methylomarinum roseum TaxID=3067653 RepID=A0AAU7NNW8_9GAMM|nr:type II toxin-antitoxin system Phd/YefM family antitoxin [Methylomarinum sp. Ch1-1]MDP4523112.1 type II toxin-antitoxin system Phd/YefM family antitoxin [Methylomarinum sp. Ch1-1]
MITIPAKEAKLRFGQFLDMAAKDTVEITKNGKPFIYSLSVDEYRKIKSHNQDRKIKITEIKQIVEDFANLQIDRHEAMYLLGISWYGDLLDLAGQFGLELKHVDEKTANTMVADFIKVMSNDE